jgi:heme-degrading monooxygenase HmoA
MVIVTNRIPVAAGHEEAFEERFKNRAHLIDKSPGFLWNKILRPIKRRLDHKTGEIVETDETTYYLVQTAWESEDRFWDWTKSPEFMQAHKNRPPAEMFAGPNVLEIHEIAQTTEKS